MTEPKKKPGPKPGAKYKSKPGPVARKVQPPTEGGATKANNQTAIGQTITDGKTHGRKAYSDEIIATARALWEGDPSATHAEVAKELGLRATTLNSWSKKYGWAKRKQDMSERAHAVADTYTSKLSELGPEITTEQQQQAEADAAEETAANLRAQVLERHRKEWNVPRVLVGEAVKDRNFDKAKLAKITSETLKIVQDAERKAWGIDSGPEGAPKVHVVIERT